MKFIRLFLSAVSKLFFNIMVIVFGVGALFMSVCENPEVESLLSSYAFGTGETEVIVTGKEPVHFKSWYSSVEDVLNGNGAIAAATEAEGAVLLKNNNDALPLDKSSDKVSLFGVTAYDPMYSLQGAGKIIVNDSRKQYFQTELENVGVDVNKDLASWYKANPSFKRSGPNGNGQNSTINGASWTDINTDAKTKAGYNTAIFVIGRMGNEAIDLPPYVSNGNSGLTDGDYLKLTPKEVSVLQGLKAQKDAGVFDKIIVLINAANTIQEDFINNSAYGIDAAMWIGFPGSDGIKAVASLLVGKSTPSGRLSAMWYNKRTANPNWQYYSTSGTVIYQEGIYVGYKYAETRYEDYVLQAANAGEYIYNNNVTYPFGYGLSYSTFSYSEMNVAKVANSEDYNVTVKVTNTGDVAGKEVVQVYLQQPYTSTNKANGVEKPSVELVGFDKTKKLNPGESETLTITVDANKYFAAYDKVKNTYVMDSGTYYLAVAKDSHDAVNNILAKKGKTPANTNNRMIATGNANLVKDVNFTSAQTADYSYKTHGGAEVTNLFDHADPNTVDPSGNKLTFMSRNNWSGTVSDTKQNVTETTARKAGRAYDSGNNYETVKNTQYADVYQDVDPTYGKVLDESIMLAEMIGVEYEKERGATDEDIQKWNNFLDQLTWDEVVTIVANGRRSTAAVASIAKPYTNDVNASNGISWRFNMKLNDSNANPNIGFSARFDKSNRNKYPTGYPCEGIVAATFNVDIAYAVGQAIGEDALWSGASGLYGFGLNLQRNPYHGRAGEYYSDDPYLTGIMAGWSSKGAQEKGLYAYNKHFVLNDQETSRSSYATWITEQALRQAHLRPFEMAIEIGDAMCVMTAFNRIGTYWSGNDYNLMTKCLRGELGMRGFAVTDWYKSTGMNMTCGILAGQDLPDGYASGEFNNKGPGTGNGRLGQAMRISAQRILYTVANSNAMNFFGDDTVVNVYDPAWFAVRDNAYVVVQNVFNASVICIVATTGWNIFAALFSLKKKKK